MNILGIIPARFASSRFPGKPLADILGQSMIQRVIGQVRQSSAISHLLVATDDPRIFNHVRELGQEVVMTSADHPSGTDRCLEALEKSGLTPDAVINIQGDEPFIDPAQIDLLASLITRPHVEIGTLIKTIEDPAMLSDPNKVKVVMGTNDRVLYFSRQAIPFLRAHPQDSWASHFQYYKHLGLYAYKTAVLREVCGMKPSLLELAESLEQLRWLENGKNIHACETQHESPSIDTPEDLTRVLASM